MMDIAVQAMLYVSGILAVIGSLGLIRFPDFYTRTHAATVISVGGFSLGLLALAVSTFWSVYSLKIMAVMALNLMTNPTATHAIAESAYRLGVKPKRLAKNEMRE
jgi:multicomponent Na+:H+ antiporter subunit G